MIGLISHDNTDTSFCDKYIQCLPFSRRFCATAHVGVSGSERG